MTCPVAWTPASVRPAPSTRVADPLPSRPSASSRTPWTVRIPGLTWNPAKSVPSYSTRARQRREDTLSGIVLRALDELDLDDLCRVAAALTDPDDPGVPGGAVGVLGSDLVEQLVDDERLVRELGHDRPTGREVAALSQRDHLLDSAGDLLGLRLGRLHLLVADHGHGQVLEQAEPGSLLAAELAPADAMRGHRLALRLVFLERLIAVQVVEAVGLRLGDDEAAHAQSLLHLVERLLAEVTHPQQVVVLELEQLPHLDDVVALERVVGPHGQVELLDRHVEHVRRERGDAGDGSLRDRGHADRDERAELVDQDLGRAAQGLLRADGPVGLDLDRQLVEVGHLTDPHAVHPVVDLADRREDRVDGDDADREGLGALGAEIPDAALDREVHLDRHVVGVEGHQDEVRVDDLDVGRLGNVGSGHGAGPALDEPELDRVGREALEPELLDVQDDLGDVFLDPRDRRELLVHVTDLDAGDGGPFQGRQQDTAKGVAEGHAVAGLKGARLVLGVRAGFLDRLDLRVLEFDHEGGLPRVVLDHELLVEIERHLVAAGRRDDGAGQVGRIDDQPFRRLMVAEGLLRDLERLAVAADLADLDLVARPELVRRDVGGDAVDREVAVADELAGSRSGGREAHPVDDVVQAQLERAQQVLAGHAGPILGRDEVVPELPLEDAVGLADLLLLAQLQAVLADLAAADAVLAGRRRSSLERALLRIAARALEIELRAFTPADPADGFGVASHVSPDLDPAPLGRAAAVVRDGRDVGDGADLEAGGLER